VQRFANLVSHLEAPAAHHAIDDATLDELFAMLADAASLLTVGRVGVHVDDRVRAVLFNLTARAEIMLRRRHRAGVLGSAPSSAAMASATLRHLDRHAQLSEWREDSDIVIDLTNEAVMATRRGA